MFGQVLDKLSTWFGRAFLLSRYFPCLLFAIVNAAIAYAAFPIARDLLKKVFFATSGDKAIYIIGVLGAVAVISYAIAPFGQFVTRLLEGAYLPQWLAEVLVLAQARQLEAQAEEERRLFLDRAALPEAKHVISRLATVREAGAALKRIADAPSIHQAETKIAALRVKRYLRRRISSGELIAAIGAIADALRRNCAEVGLLRLPVSVEEHSAAEKLSDLHTELTVVLVPYAKDIAEEKEAVAVDRIERLFARGELAPTRLGNDAAALRGYCRTRYGIEFDFFWPRFQLVLQKNDKLSSAIAGAKIQLDFTILSLALTVVSTIVWIGLLYRLSDNLLLLVSIIFFGPLSTAFWLGAVHASHSEFAEVVRSAVDIGRFEVLQALRLPLPATTKVEKRTWERTARMAMLGEESVDFTLKHPPQS
jgi:hypothetical protein